MAKTTGPNLLGIHKEMLEAGKDTRAESLVGGAAQAFAVNIAEQEKAEAEMEKHMENLGGIENIGKISEQQRGPVTEFLRANRDEYAELAKQYAKSKDPAIKDKMDAIKYKFENLNTQLSTFATNKGEYMLDYEEGNLMKGGSFAKDNAFYTSVYGNPNAQFTIDGDGTMSFTVNGETRKLEDFGEHTLRNYDGEKYADDLFLAATTAKWSGGQFDKASFSRNFVNQHKGISRNDLSALLQTDLSGDDALGGNSNLSFMRQWETGTMGDEFYAGFTKDETTGKYNITEEDVNNLLNDKQRGLDLMGKYVGNVSQDLFGIGKESPDVMQNRQYKQAQIDAMNKKKNEKGVTKDNYSGSIILDNGKQYHRKHWQVIELGENYNDKDKIKDYSGAYWEWDNAENHWTDGTNSVSHEDMATKMQIPDELIIEGEAWDSEDPEDISIKTASLNTEGDVVVGGLSTSEVSGSDDEVKTLLNTYLPVNNPKNYYFDEKPDYFLGGDPGWEDPTQNAVVLKDGNGNTMTYPNGDRIMILTSGGGGVQNTPNEVENSIKKFNDWIGKQNDFSLSVTGQTKGTTRRSDKEPKTPKGDGSGTGKTNPATLKSGETPKKGKYYLMSDGEIMQFNGRTYDPV